MKSNRMKIFAFITVFASFAGILTFLSTHHEQKDSGLTNARRLKDELKYPIISSSPMPEKDSIEYTFIEFMDVIDVKGDRVYVMIHHAKEYFEYEVVIKDARFEKEATAELHKEPEPYTSPYFARKSSNTPDYSTINGYSCYRDVEGTYQTMEYLNTTYPNLTEIIDIGPSHLKSIGEGGREMKVLKLTNKSEVNFNKSHLFIICSIHARELAPAEACTRFAEDLLEQYGTDSDKTWILDYTEIHMILEGNPDGREDEEANLHLRRKNMNFGEPISEDCEPISPSIPCLLKKKIFEPDRRTQSCVPIYPCFETRNGVDLNRNFPHSQWNTVGTGSRCDETFAGYGAGSEQETINIVNYMEGVLPPGTNQRDPQTGAYPPDTKGVLMDVHSFGQDFFWPYAYSASVDEPNDIELTAFAKKLASHTSPEYSHDNVVYFTSGDTTDWAYDAIGIAPFTIEMGISFHEGCTNFEDVELANAMNSLLYAARVANAPYQLPLGPEIFWMSVGTSENQVELMIKISDSERALGYTTGNQGIVSLNVFIDEHPYLTNATPAFEQTYPGTSSSVIDSILFNTTGFDLGEDKHILYLQAFDTNGPGPVYSRYI